MRQALIGYEVQQETIAEKIFDIIYFLKKWASVLKISMPTIKRLQINSLVNILTVKLPTRIYCYGHYPANDDPY